MDIKERQEYQKKIKRYERLGALKFQNLVFLVERIKYRIIKTLFPNFIKFYDKRCDRLEKKELKKARTESERKRIKEKTKLAKMSARKELYEEKNRNYHINLKRPTEILYYLQWNKNIHKLGLIKNGVLAPLAIAGIFFQIPGSVVFLILELISATINFECVNIQNYNILRVERLMPVLQERERNRVSKEIDKFGAAAEVIHRRIEESESLPSFSDIIESINDPEQLRQMKEMFKKAQEERMHEKKYSQGKSLTSWNISQK